MTAPRPRAGRLARLDRVLLDRDRGLARRRARSRDLRRLLLRGQRRDVGVHDRLPGPNLVRSLFADAAIQAAFVPVFTEKLEQGDRREAFRLASNMIFVVTLVLGALTALFILIAPVLMPLFVPASDEAMADLTVTLSRVLFPILVLLGATGMVVGILNSYDRFGALRDLAVLLERRDHRRARRAGAGVPGGRPDLRVRDRRPGRHRRSARDPALRPAQHAVRDPARAAAPRSRAASARRFATSTCGGCCC